jgi:hypothetical protein
MCAMGHFRRLQRDFEMSVKADEADVETAGVPVHASVGRTRFQRTDLSSRKKSSSAVSANTASGML